MIPLLPRGASGWVPPGRASNQFARCAGGDIHATCHPPCASHPRSPQKRLERVRWPPGNAHTPRDVNIAQRAPHSTAQHSPHAYPEVTELLQRRPPQVIQPTPGLPRLLEAVRPQLVTVFPSNIPVPSECKNSRRADRHTEGCLELRAQRPCAATRGHDPSNTDFGNPATSFQPALQTQTGSDSRGKGVVRVEIPRGIELSVLPTDLNNILRDRVKLVLVLRLGFLPHG